MNDSLHQRRVLEVCIASVDATIAAAEGGADRVELNTALELDGLSPSAGLLSEVQAATSLPIIAMVRPRGGDFCYADIEKTVMLRDAEFFLAHGVHGIACGALTADGRIDREFCHALIALAGEREVVFHRAFDVVKSQTEALEILVDLGVTRVLTSGGAATALAGAAQLARLVRQAAARIEILPAAGIAAEHVAELLRITGCSQIHGTFRDRAGGSPNTSRVSVAAARAALDAAILP